MRLSGGPSRGRKLGRPDRSRARPPLARLRQSVFAILGGRVEGSRVLDLFAGVGTFGLEALGRGAAEVVFVERDRRALRSAEESLRALGFRPRAHSLPGDALLESTWDEACRWRCSLSTADEPAPTAFDLVFLDPPFRLFDGAEGVARLRRALSALLAGPWLRPGGVVVLRAPRRRRVEIGAAATDHRTYGRSEVYIFERPPEDAAASDP